MGVNLRFDNYSVQRGPVFRMGGPLVLNTSPKHMVPFFQLGGSGTEQLYIANDNGTVTSWAFGGIGLPSVEADVTLPGWSPASWPKAYTHTTINGVVYLNRSDRVPWFVATTGSVMGAFTAGNCGWDPTWRCEALRSTSGALVAINVTKGGTSYPTMVKTSDFMVFGSLPGSWTGTPSNSATENILPTLSEPLVDGWNLRDRMVLYSAHETWLMEPTLDNQVFSYRRIFQDAGVISQNCVWEWANKHYVFGNDDIWTHDGFQKESIATARVKSFIYNYLVRDQSSQFFVYQNTNLTEICFCYLSTDPFVAFPVGGTYGFNGCNRAAVYNYIQDTWYFYDLPYVTSAGLGLAADTTTWSDLSSTAWSSISYAWYTMVGSSTLATLTTGYPQASKSLTASVRSFENVNSPFVSGNVDITANGPCYGENLYVDLDQISPEIRGYKVVNSVYPIASFDANAAPMTFYFGAADYSNSPPPVYQGPMTFDGGSNYKLDFMTSGRFISFKILYSDYRDFDLSGFDFNLVVTGKR